MCVVRGFQYLWRDCLAALVLQQSQLFHSTLSIIMMPMDICHDTGLELSASQMFFLCFKLIDILCCMLNVFTGRTGLLA